MDRPPMQEKLHILLPKLHINAVDILPNPATIEYRTPVLSFLQLAVCIIYLRKAPTHDRHTPRR
jgi:hypothetical protein